MMITDVAWSSDLRRGPVLELRVDASPAYVHSSQRTELTRRGLLDGMVFLMPQIEANERRHGHQFYDPPETVYQWLLDQQRRVQAT